MYSRHVLPIVGDGAFELRKRAQRWSRVRSSTRPSDLGSTVNPPVLDVEPGLSLARISP
jgi:hypothetical protein